MTTPEIKELIIKELPNIVKEDLTVRQMILDLSRQHFADKQETESRFDRIMDELQRDREENARKWDAHMAKWDRHIKDWETFREEDKERWEEHRKRTEATDRRIETIDRRIEALLKKSEEHDRQIRELFEKSDKNREMFRQDMRDIFGALSARWGLRSEASFRNGLRAILAESFQVEVQNIVEYDDTGEVFGRPDQIELEIIIKNGVLIACEIKSSMSKNDMYLFERKVRFYEKLHNRKAQRLIVISPMIADTALEVAKKLGIETYDHSEHVPSSPK